MQYLGRMLSGEQAQITFTPITMCPKCKSALVPFPLSGIVYQNEFNDYLFSFTAYCEGCKSVIQSDYSVSKLTTGSNKYSEKNYLSSSLNLFVKKEFDKKINELSSMFVKIYNQALAAETNELDEIAGLGYRKAMEFLIKDFCIHLNPDKDAEIKALPLGRCISTYVQNEQIQILATKATWIGNDEAHYVRKQETRDVHDMKEFIKAMVYFVGMVLITEDASSMSPG